MDTNPSILFVEIETELKKLLPEEEIKRFHSILTQVNEKIDLSGSIDVDNLYQISKNLDSGSGIRDNIDRLITFSEPILSTLDQCSLLIGIGHYLINAGELDLAADIAQDIHNKSVEIGSKKFEAESFLIKSKVEWNQNHWDESFKCCETGLEIYKKLNDDLGIAKFENMLGTIWGEKGELDIAQSHFEKALALLDSSNNLQLKAMCHINLGILLNIRNEHDKTREQYEIALNILDRVDDPKNSSRLNHNLGMLYALNNEYEKALDNFNKCIDVSLDRGYLSNCAISFIGKAYVYAKQGENRLSDAFLDKAMEFSFKVNDRLSIADIYRIKGIIHKNISNPDLSIEFFNTSLRLNKDFESQPNQAEINIELSELYQELNRTEDSESFQKEAEQYFNKIKKTDN